MKLVFQTQSSILRHSRGQFRNLYYHNICTAHQGRVSLNSAKPSKTPVTMKDRIPLPGTQVHDGKRKLAILADAVKVSSESYPFIDEIVKTKGTVCLRRYFDYESRPPWKVLEDTFGFEWFRVDGFIPIHMQIISDAAHLIEYHKENLITAVVMVVTQREAEAYSRYFERLKGNGVSVYVCHERALFPTVLEE